MDNNCIRILRIVSVMDRGGIETQIMNIYRKLDRNNFQFDFLVTRDEKGIFDDEINKLGGQIYHVPSIRKVGLFKFVKSIDNFFKKHSEYKIVHSHMNTWSGLFLHIAKKYKIPIRIAQSHSAQQGIKSTSVKEILESIFKGVMKLFIKSGATHFWAVSEAAGKWLFGVEIANSKMKIIPNAKDLNIYKFDLDARESLRKDLGISPSTLVVGHVGSFSPVKNHLFLVELFSELRKLESDSVLCLVGDGILFNNIKNEVLKKGLEEYVLFLGSRNDVHKLMSAFDVLVLPSKFEGMPNVVIEAQATALSCIISDSITKEVDMGMGIVEFVSLSDKFDNWIKAIIKGSNNSRNIKITNMRTIGYDLDELVISLQEFYKYNI
ncbi:MAG TPA: glycosyltransferase family 1 protein [Patescibacteria group bacterium]|nr:glycosyltransferase family 1 protein [Patescibacteria group bacterium]